MYIKFEKWDHFCWIRFLRNILQKLIFMVCKTNSFHNYSSEIMLLFTEINCVNLCVDSYRLDDVRIYQFSASEIFSTPWENMFQNYVEKLTIMAETIWKNWRKVKNKKFQVVFCNTLQPKYLKNTQNLSTNLWIIVRNSHKKWICITNDLEMIDTSNYNF